MKIRSQVLYCRLLYCAANLVDLSRVYIHRMPSEKVPNPVESRFRYNAVLKRSFCLLEPCASNNISFNGRHLGNLKVHLQRLHQLEHGKVDEEQAAINIQKRSTTPPQKKKRKINSSIPVFLDAEEVIEACVTIVTENGSPFKALDDRVSNDTGPSTHWIRWEVENWR